MLRLVLDTDVMVAAFQSPTGASREILSRILDGEFTILLSTSLMLEYEAVLTRPSVLARCGIGEIEVLAVLDELALHGEAVTFDYRWRPAAGDPDDDFVPETAMNGGAAMILSFNLAHLADGAARCGIPVERPGSFLARMGQ